MLPDAILQNDELMVVQLIQLSYIEDVDVKKGAKRRLLFPGLTSSQSSIAIDFSVLFSAFRLAAGAKGIVGVTLSFPPRPQMLLLVSFADAEEETSLGITSVVERSFFPLRPQVLLVSFDATEETSLGITSVVERSFFPLRPQVLLVSFDAIDTTEPSLGKIFVLR